VHCLRFQLFNDLFVLLETVQSIPEPGVEVSRIFKLLLRELAFEFEQLLHLAEVMAPDHGFDLLLGDPVHDGRRGPGRTQFFTAGNRPLICDEQVNLLLQLVELQSRAGLKRVQLVYVFVQFVVRLFDRFDAVLVALPVLLL
jgi:hypothetical protein